MLTYKKCRQEQLLNGLRPQPDACEEKSRHRLGNMGTTRESAFHLSLVLGICDEGDRKEFTSDANLMPDEATIFVNSVRE
jgi:hypothetical protein